MTIDTLEDFRRRGFAEAAVRELARHLRAQGREPVWGAAEDNPASLALARKLGFQVVDRVYLFSTG